MIKYDEEYLMKGEELIFGFWCDEDDEDDNGYVALVPRDFWKNEGGLYYEPIFSVTEMLENNDIWECERWVYNFDTNELSEQKVREILVGLGLEEDAEFTEWLKGML